MEWFVCDECNEGYSADEIDEKIEYDGYDFCCEQCLLEHVLKDAKKVSPPQPKGKPHIPGFWR